MEINRELLKGSISLLLLNLLSRGEMYGYEILQAAVVRSANAFEFKEGTLYPALHHLEKKGNNIFDIPQILGAYLVHERPWNPPRCNHPLLGV